MIAAVEAVTMEQAGKSPEDVFQRHGQEFHALLGERRRGGGVRPDAEIMQQFAGEVFSIVSRIRSSVSMSSFRLRVKSHSGLRTNREAFFLTSRIRENCAFRTSPGLCFIGGTS